jgi:hypothetical protein
LTLFLSSCRRKRRDTLERRMTHAIDKGKYKQYLARHQSPMRPAIPCNFNPNLQRPDRFDCVCLLIS